MNAVTSHQHAAQAQSFTPFRFEVKPTELALAGIEKIQSLCKPEVTSSISHEQRRTWTLELGEALCMLEEAENLSSIHFSQDPKRPGAEESLQKFAEQIGPNIATAKELARSSMRTMYEGKEIPAELRSYLRQSETLSSLFCRDNLPILTQQDRIETSYQSLAATITAEHNESKHRLDELANRFEFASRDEREKLWTAIWQARFAHRQAHHDILSDLIPLRITMRDNALPQGEVSEYFYRQRSSEFSQHEIDLFAETLRREMSPLTYRIYDNLRQKLGVAALKPWDVSCTRYFEYLPRTEQSATFPTTQALVTDIVGILNELSPKLPDIFHKNIASGAIDIETRDGKAADQYAAVLPFSRGAFCQTRTHTGTEAAQTLIHEFGHFTHFTLSSSQEFGPSRCERAMECAELASLGLEFLAAAHILSTPRWANSPLHRETALGIIKANILFLPYAVQVTQFQNWIYKNPGHSIEAREQQWRLLDGQFGPPIDWSSYEHIRGMQWQQQPHIFIYPFYYPQYAIAICGAMDLFNRYVKASSAEDKKEVIDRFLGALSLGCSVSGREVFTRAGASFMPKAAVLRESVSRLMTYLR